MDPVRRMSRQTTLTLALTVQILLFLLSFPAPAATNKTPSSAAKPLKITAPAPAEPQPELRLFKGATFLLPEGAKVEPRWVLPPSEKNSSSAIFSVNAAGSPVFVASDFLGYGDTYLLHPDQKYLVAMDAGISGITHLANGALLLASGADLVLPAEPRQKTFDKKGLPFAALQPLTSLPLRKIDVLTSVGNTVYCAGADSRSGRHSLYLLRTVKGAGLQDLELAYESGEAITAVTGDDEGIYVAKGPNVIRVSLKDGSEIPYYTHPSSTVKGLAKTPAGLLVSTDKELVLAGHTGAMEIMSSSGHRIAMRGDTLYLLFTNSLGVLAIDNLADLKRFDLSVKSVVPGEEPPPLSIGSVRFFESDSLENSRGFAESFNRADVRRIIAQIDYAKPERNHAITVSWHEPTGGQLASTTYRSAQWGGERIFAAIGGESGGGYIHPHQLMGGGQVYKFGKDALGVRYPGRYRMLVQVDGVPVGEWAFTLVGQVEPWEAIAYDDTATLKTLLDQGLSPRRKNEEGVPLLSEAVQFGSVRAVQMLLERGAEPNDTDQKGRPPLAECVYANDWRAKADLLVRHGADVNAPSYSGGLPMAIGLSSSGHLVEFLVKNGARIRHESSSGPKSILGEMWDSTCTEGVLSLLLQRGADLNENLGPYQYVTPLGKAISRAGDRCVELLLDKGASPGVVQTEPNRPPRSALHLALSTLADRSEPKEKAALRRIVRLLVQKGANFRPGKKISTSAYFAIPRHEMSSRLLEERVSIVQGEGRYMFHGEGPYFFEPADLIKTLEEDDTALEAASLSTDPAIRELALGMHLSRVRELTAKARDEYDLGYEAHAHCEQAFQLAEAGYRPLQVDVVPAPGAQGKSPLGILLLKRSAGGAYVQGLVPGGAAERAGLKAGDIILALDTQKMKDVEEIVATAARLPAGMPVRVTFLRDDPMRLPDLQLTCGLLEKEVKDLSGLAEMNLSRWLAAHPNNVVAKEVRVKIKELATSSGRR